MRFGDVGGIENRTEFKKELKVTECEEYTVRTACTADIPEYRGGVLFKYKPLRAESNWFACIRRLLSSDKPIDVWEDCDCSCLAIFLAGCITEWNLDAKTNFGFGSLPILSGTMARLPQPVLHEMLAIISGGQKSAPLPIGKTLYRETAQLL